jgi:hypothetical protein
MYSMIGYRRHKGEELTNPLMVALRLVRQEPTTHDHIRTLLTMPLVVTHYRSELGTRARQDFCSRLKPHRLCLAECLWAVFNMRGKFRSRKSLNLILVLSL